MRLGQMCGITLIVKINSQTVNLRADYVAEDFFLRSFIFLQISDMSTAEVIRQIAMRDITRGEVVLSNPRRMATPNP